jgi:hypothetical protein
MCSYFAHSAIKSHVCASTDKLPCINLCVEDTGLEITPGGTTAYMNTTLVNYPLPGQVVINGSITGQRPEDC